MTGRGRTAELPGGDDGRAASHAALVRRAVTTAGPAGAPPLVLLHGTRRTRAMWRLQLDGLADTFCVIAADLPGHGALADVPFSLDDAGEFVAAVIEEAAGGRAIIVGQSLGGYVGMELASRRPELVAGLVLANATAEPRTIARRAPRTVGSYLVVAAGELLHAQPRPAGRRDGDSPGDPPADATADATALPDDGPATNGWLFKGGARALVTALRTSFIPRLAAYPGPTLIVNGEDDRLFRHGEQTFLEAAADGRLVLIPGTGHLVNEEQPVAFNAALRQFAAEVHGGAPTVAPGSVAGRGADQPRT